MALPPLSLSSPPSIPCLLNSSQLRLVGAWARLFPPFWKERKEGTTVCTRALPYEEERGEARRGMREACKTDVHLPGAHNFSRERGTEVGKKRVRKEVDARGGKKKKPSVVGSREEWRGDAWRASRRKGWTGEKKEREGDDSRFHESEFGR